MLKEKLLPQVIESAVNQSPLCICCDMNILFFFCLRKITILLFNRNKLIFKILLKDISKPRKLVWENNVNVYFTKKNLHYNMLNLAVSEVSDGPCYNRNLKPRTEAYAVNLTDKYNIGLPYNGKNGSWCCCPKMNLIKGLIFKQYLIWLYLHLILEVTYFIINNFENALQALNWLVLYLSKFFRCDNV